MIHRALFGLVALLFLASLARDRVDAWVDATRLPPLIHATSQEVVDRDGMLLRAYQVEDGIWRLATTPDAVDPGFLEMLVATEDKRFHTHAGVDPLAMFRAAGQAVWNGRIVSGGSTLTMQAARLIENTGTGGWSGKLRQIRVALALERRLTKADILTLYLTHAPYGGNVEGVRAASLAWFGKPPRHLAPEEAALLVALPQAPESRRPDRHPAAATRARDRILALRDQPPARRAVPSAMRAFPATAAHLADRARMTEPDMRILQVTLRADLQTALERLAGRAVQGLPPKTSAAILVADHHSGEVLAHVGAAGYAQMHRAGFVDMVRAVRSPGSTLKPLIYALAFDQGLAHPETVMPDRPVAFGSYAPQNFDGSFRGDVTVRQALEQSLNIPPLLLTEAMGPARLMAALERSGAAPQVPGGRAGLAVALGGVGLTLEDLVRLYGGLANGGVAQPLVWRAGEARAEGHRVVSRSAAWQVGHILAGIRPPDGQPPGRVAFKTGTSYGHRDAWAIGWDGRHVVGVWLGRPDGTPVPGVFGGDVAAPILFEAFGRLKPQLDPLPPPPPETLMQSTALLPRPLQEFRPRRGEAARRDDFGIAFPPDGARLLQGSDPSVPVKLQGGTPPFAILSNGRPLLTGLRDRELELSGVGTGYSTLEAVDATGRSDRVRVQLGR